jgi:hypothetical protein
MNTPPKIFYNDTEGGPVKKEAQEGRKAALAELMRAAAGMPDLLAMRRQAFEAGLRAVRAQ